jgi:hypothetical protein
MKTIELLFNVIDSINEDLEEGQKLTKSPETIIFGHNSVLDSMGLINFITLTEEKIEEVTGKYVSIADERAMSMSENPFKTINSLSNYIDQLLNEE